LHEAREIAIRFDLSVYDASYLHLALERLSEDEAYVPGLWPYEVGNALLVAERRGRIRQGDVEVLIRELEKFPIRIVAQPGRRILHEAREIAIRFDLSVYDASYLHLALERKLSLATLDGKLTKAALEAGVEVI
jgi:predicted nucleic acid-binding protein